MSQSFQYSSYIGPVVQTGITKVKFQKKKSPKALYLSELNTLYYNLNANMFFCVWCVGGGGVTEQILDLDWWYTLR